MIESNHVVLWNRCLDVIKDNVPETTYNTWFAPIVPLKYEDKTLILQIPSQFFYEILEERFVDLIRKTLYKVIGEGTKLMYNVMVDKTSIPNQTVNLEASNRSTAVTPKSIIGGNKAPSFLQAPAVQDLDPHLNPNYNFENFIEGYSNKLSRSVAEAVAQKPGGTAFNPLFLYGASGVGKRQRKAIEAQKNAQKELNEQAASLNYEYGEKAAENAYQRQLAMYNKSYEDQSYEAMVKQMEEAGLSVGLMYGGSGSGGGAGAMSGAPKADTGGAVAGQATSAAALMEAENQRKALALQRVSMAKDIQLKDAEIELKKKEAEKAGKESLYTEALTETENILRNAKVHREFWEGRLSWIENLRKQFEDVTTPSEDGELNATEDMYGNYEIISEAIGTASKAASVLKVIAETGTEKQRKVCLAAETALTNEKVKGYWKELEAAIKNADSQAIIAAATKLDSETKRMDIEHKYGVKMTVKQWIELGIGVTGAVAGTIGAGALIKNGMTTAKEAANKLKGKSTTITSTKNYNELGQFKGESFTTTINRKE